MARAQVSGGGRARAVTLALVAAGMVTTLARAQRVGAQPQQRRPPPRPEVRVDYLGPDPHALHGGVGVNVPFGSYLRLGLVGAGGPSWHGTRAATSARADVIARFAFDPFRERRWGLSAGGGVSVRYDDGAAADRRRWRTLIALVVDLEGPRIGAAAPAIQLGLGGGARLGLVIRGAAADRR